MINACVCVDGGSLPDKIRNKDSFHSHSVVSHSADAGNIPQVLLVYNNASWFDGVLLKHNIKYNSC